MLFKVFVDRQTVSRFTYMYPIGNIGHFSHRLTLTLLQEDDVSCDLCSCVIFKRTVLATRQTDSTDEVSLVSQHLASAFVTLIESACRGHECHDSAVFQFHKN